MQANRNWRQRKDDIIETHQGEQKHTGSQIPSAHEDWSERLLETDASDLSQTCKAAIGSTNDI